MRRGLVLTSLCLLAAVSIAAACDNGRDYGDAVPLDSGVQGIVTIGPTCPVEQENSPCPDEAFQADITIFDEDGDEVASFESSEDGRYRFNLPPGTYRLVPQADANGLPSAPPERFFEVQQGFYTDVDIQYDSGIR